MPRTARLDTPGLLHHIMIRGIERRKIFNDDKDRENLIERLSILLPETKTQLGDWAGSEDRSQYAVSSKQEKVERAKLKGQKSEDNRFIKQVA